MPDPTVIEDGGIISPAKYRGLIEKWIEHDRSGPGDYVFNLSIREDYSLTSQLFKSFTNWADYKLCEEFYLYMGRNDHFDFKEEFEEYVMRDDVFDRVDKFIKVVDVGGSVKEKSAKEIKAGDYMGKLTDIGVVDSEGGCNWPKLRGFIVSVVDKHINPGGEDGIYDIIDSCAEEEVGGVWHKFRMSVGRDNYEECVTTLYSNNDKFKNMIDNA